MIKHFTLLQKPASIIYLFRWRTADFSRRLHCCRSAESWKELVRLCMWGCTDLVEPGVPHVVQPPDEVGRQGTLAAIAVRPLAEAVSFHGPRVRRTHSSSSTHCRPAAAAIAICVCRPAHNHNAVTPRIQRAADNTCIQTEGYRGASVHCTRYFTATSTMLRCDRQSDLSLDVIKDAIKAVEVDLSSHQSVRLDMRVTWGNNFILQLHSRS